jgi:hypothetical protein
MEKMVVFCMIALIIFQQIALFLPQPMGHMKISG